MNTRIVLASESPRRQELLERMGCRFIVVPSGLNEDDFSCMEPADHANTLAKAKAVEVSQRFSEDFVLAADTVVSLKEKCYGKPESREHAFRMLKQLSGKRHCVTTGVCIARGGAVLGLDSLSTYVWFDDLSETSIKRYLDTNEYADKAGAYGIQGLGALFVKRIDGCYFNVMGLPLQLVEMMFKKIGKSFYYFI